MAESAGKVTVNYQLTITQHVAIKGKIQTNEVEIECKNHHSKTLFKMGKEYFEKIKIFSRKKC